ncbi:GTP cyclohydrolase 1 [Elasticomyces elasticus]|nr:GTP cyclohydrolase 1 [Elasticomyces elasticus]
MTSNTSSATTYPIPAADCKRKDNLTEDLSTKPAPLTDGVVVGFNGLSVPTDDTRSRIDDAPEQIEKRLQKMYGAVRSLLECVGEDPNREGLLATPSRYAKALLFLTKGYRDNVENIVSNALFHEGHHEMVVVKDIKCYSLCEHHLLPFTGKIHIGYIPSGTVIGLSKLSRIVEMFSRRLQIQERLTNEVARAIIKVLNPEGVAVIMESCHLCMEIPGVEKTGATTITSCVLGCFKETSATYNEFLNRIVLNRK